MAPRRALLAILVLALMLLAPSAGAAESRPLFDADLADARGDVVTFDNRSADLPSVDVVSFTSREENGTIVQTVTFAANFTAPNDSIYIASLFRDAAGRNASMLEIMLDGGQPPERRLRATLRDGPRESVTHVGVEYGVQGNVAKFFIPSSVIPADATCFHPSLHAEHTPASRDALHGKDQLAPSPPRCGMPESEAFERDEPAMPDLILPRANFPQPTPAPGTDKVPGPAVPLILGGLAVAAALLRRK